MDDNLNQVIRGFEENARKLSGGDSTLIFKIKRNKDIPRLTILLTNLDSTVANMPNAEKTKLYKRFSDIIPDNAVEYIREYDDQFLEALVEFLGWGWLKERYPSYKPQFNPTPDLVVCDDNSNIVAAMECKHIRTSDEDRDYYQSHQGERRTVKGSLLLDDYSQNPFLRKLKDTLDTAKGQVNQSNAADKFIFLDLSFDTPFQFPPIKDEIIRPISGLASDLSQEGIILYAFEQFQVDEPIIGARLP